MATYVTGANTKFEEKQIWIARTYTRPLRNFGVYDGDFRLKQVKKHYIFNIFIQLLRQSFSKITNF